MGVIQRQGLQGQKQGTWIHEGEIGGAFALTCILLGVENRHSILSTQWDPEGLLFPAGPGPRKDAQG